MTPDDHDRGLYQKFIVRRADGRDETPSDKHYGCTYVVLDITHDPFALPALAAYADACAPTHRALADDLREVVRSRQPLVHPEGPL